MTQKREASEDLRVRRNRKMLQQAFVELTVEKGFAELTVRDITDEPWSIAQRFTVIIWINMTCLNSI